MNEILLTCPRSFPPYLRKELEALGYNVTEEHRAGIEIKGTLEDCMRLNLWLRTAHRVLYRLASVEADTPAQMYDAVYNIPWEKWIAANGYVSVISSIDTPSIDNSQFANVKCKDAIVDRMRQKFGKRPDSGSDVNQTVVYLYWHDSTCMVYIDTSGTPLSERGYRIHPGKAPMRESLAAAVIMATNWEPGQAFVNPMSGSGTLGIEAAMMALNIAPGSLRRNYGFMHVLPYDEDKWKSMLENARDAERKPSDYTGAFMCSDTDKQVVRKAQENARKAGVGQAMKFTTSDFRTSPVPDPPGIVIFNPEYGLRLGDVQELELIYEEIGDFFKQRCANFTGYIFSGNMPLLKKVGLRSKRRIEFWTADIECRLVEYPLYVGS